MKLTVITAGVLLSTSSFAQYCTSGGPTTTVDSNVQSVQLTGSSGSISFTGCPGVIGVQNLTNLSTTLNATTGYTLYVQFGTCNGNYLGSGEAWIDYDQSNTFDPNESVGTWTGTPPVPLSVFSFSVPANAHNGTTRMRVMQHEGGLTPPLDPCASFSWGSVMDFSIVITGGINCTGYIGDNIHDPKIVPSMPYTDNGDNSFCYSNQNPAYPSPDVYYRVVVSPNSSSIHASLCGSSFDSFLSVIDTIGHVIAYNDDGTNCAPQSDLTFSTIGLDTVYVIVEGWGMQSGPYTLTLTEDLLGVKDNMIRRVDIYPDPVNDHFTINGISDGDVVITDPLGNEVLHLEHYNGTAIDASPLATGFYFVGCNAKGSLYSAKMIVTR